jgi:hypothetical protein
VHMLDSGHFAVEDHLDVIAEHIKRFYGEKVATAARAMAAEYNIEKQKQKSFGLPHQ